MPQPSVTTVTIDGDKFDALTASVSFSTATDSSGMPMMGSFNSSIEVIVDLHDNKNMPFSTVKKLFELAKVVTKDKVKDVKIEFWQDENRQDVLCSYAFKGWISHWHTGSGGGTNNHTLSISVQPAIDTKNYNDLRISN
ncbi:MAG TPA: hypothetical protein VGQ12_17865 [Candidatus Angelobacter sp.]|jgi:hypothetical protein|nr:hypothetical protein [Candidatus Angelobacter sp.]